MIRNYCQFFSFKPNKVLPSTEKVSNNLRYMNSCTSDPTPGPKALHVSWCRTRTSSAGAMTASHNVEVSRLPGLWAFLFPKPLDEPGPPNLFLHTMLLCLAALSPCQQTQRSTAFLDSSSLSHSTLKTSLKARNSASKSLLTYPSLLYLL